MKCKCWCSLSCSYIPFPGAQPLNRLDVGTAGWTRLNEGARAYNKGCTRAFAKATGWFWESSWPYGARKHLGVRNKLQGRNCAAGQQAGKEPGGFSAHMTYA